MNTLSPPHAPVRLVAPLASLASLSSLVPLASLAPPVAYAYVRVGAKLTDSVSLILKTHASNSRHAAKLTRALIAK